MRHDPHPQLIYDFIVTYWKECGYAPTMEEIAEDVGLAYVTTREYLVQLKAWGVIDWTPQTIRTIHIAGEYQNG